MQEQERHGDTGTQRHISFLLLARIKLFDKLRLRMSQEFSLKARKVLEEYHSKIDALKSEQHQEWEAINTSRWNWKKKKELGEQYSLLDICPYSKGDQGKRWTAESISGAIFEIFAT